VFARDQKLLRIEEIEDVREWIATPGKVGPAQRDGHQLRAAGFQSVAHQLVRSKLARADDQSRRELAISDLELRGFIGHCGCSLLLAGFFSFVRTVTLNQDEKNILLRQDPTTETDGGFQKLLVTLQYLLDEATGVIELPDILLERIPRYAFDYGNGGWENRLKGIFARILGPNLGR
jgi:hypothetical protein